MKLQLFWLSSFKNPLCSKTEVNHCVFIIIIIIIITIIIRPHRSTTQAYVDSALADRVAWSVGQPVCRTVGLWHYTVSRKKFPPLNCL